MYIKQSIGLNSAQVEKLARATELEKPISFSKYSKTGKVPVYLTRGQVDRLGAAPIKFSVKQLQYMKSQGGFLGSLLKLIGPVFKAAAPVFRGAVAPLATGALTGAASYGAQRALKKAVDGKGLELKPYRNGRGLELKPYSGGNVSIELTPEDVNAIFNKKQGGFLSLLASLAAGLLPSILGSGLSRKEMEAAKKLIFDVAKQGNKKKAQTKLEQLALKHGSGLLGKLFKLPNGKVPVLGDIPLLNVLF